MTDALTGRCVCGSLQYRVNGPVTDPIACHCRECQRHSGSFWVAISTDSEAVEITGDTLSWVSISPSARRGFCGACGGFLFWQPISGETLDIAFGSLDDTHNLKLSAHLFVGEARLPIPDDDLPRFDRSRTKQEES